MSTILWLIILLLTAGLAYAIGRRSGVRQGYRIGYAAAPLDMRTQAFETGICPLCRSLPHSSCDPNMMN